MRDLLDEYGYLLITLLIASILVVAGVFGAILPRMTAYTQSSIPEDSIRNAPDDLAISENVERSSPIIDVPYITVFQDTVLDLSAYIAVGDIVAINADGVDISDRIIIQAANEETAALYDEVNAVLNCKELGDYKFVLSVKDITSSEYFGKEQKSVLYVTVVKKPETTATTSVTTATTPSE